MVTLATQGKYDEAQERILRAIRIQENCLRSDDPSLAASLAILAGVLKAQVMRSSVPAFFLNSREVVRERSLP